MGVRARACVRAWACACVRACVRECVRECMSRCVGARVCVCYGVRACARVHVRGCVGARACVCYCVHACACACVRVRVRACMHVRACMRAHLRASVRACGHSFLTMCVSRECVINGMRACATRCLRAWVHVCERKTDREILVESERARERVTVARARGARVQFMCFHTESTRAGRMIVLQDGRKCVRCQHPGKKKRKIGDESELFSLLEFIVLVSTTVRTIQYNCTAKRSPPSNDSHLQQLVHSHE